jgi:hypothetical protein
VRQQEVCYAAKPELRAHQLVLRPLAAIDQEPAPSSGDEQRRQASFGRRHRRSCTEKNEIEHPTHQILQSRLSNVAPPRGLGTSSARDAYNRHRLRVPAPSGGS